MVHKVCGNSFCAGCVHVGDACPLCRAKVRKLRSPPRMVFQALDGLRVACPTCSRVVTRGVLADHVALCERPCPLGCGASVAPAHQATHERESCAKFPIACAAAGVMCPWQGPRDAVAAHEAACAFVQLRPVLLRLLDEVSALRTKLDTVESRLAQAVQQQTVAAQQPQRPADTERVIRLPGLPDLALDQPKAKLEINIKKKSSSLSSSSSSPRIKRPVLTLVSAKDDKKLDVVVPRIEIKPTLRLPPDRGPQKSSSSSSSSSSKSSKSSPSPSPPQSPSLTTGLRTSLHFPKSPLGSRHAKQPSDAATRHAKRPSMLFPKLHFNIHSKSKSKSSTSSSV
eukprot:TRINITY_DN7026_c0_g1_i1.p1 TRINITY_DN7026_c0_g1~~TRINITY_DN7026_c0_g1_i1.p1  ORF type:complete len:387 (-),score=94.61 TRINITY_DN7026_c0_g1_i1:28-1047(-)